MSRYIVWRLVVMLFFSLFKSFLLHGLFLEGAARIAAHQASGIATVHDMMLFQSMRLPQTSIGFIHAKLSGNLDLLVDGIVIFQQSTAVFNLVIFVTHAVSLEGIHVVGLVALPSQEQLLTLTVAELIHALRRQHLD